MPALHLTRGYVAQIDECDWDVCSRFRWQAHLTRGLVYARMCLWRQKWNIRTQTRESWREVIYLHRFIIRVPEDMPVDHWDGDGLNCRRANLRVSTWRENRMNGGPAHSGYRGVSQVGLRRWRARLGDKHLGMFDTAEAAARAYDLAALLEIGPFAKLNFTQPGRGLVEARQAQEEEIPF